MTVNNFRKTLPFPSIRFYLWRLHNHYHIKKKGKKVGSCQYFTSATLQPRQRQLWDPCALGCLPKIFFFSCNPVPRTGQWPRTSFRQGTPCLDLDLHGPQSQYWFLLFRVLINPLLYTQDPLDAPKNKTNHTQNVVQKLQARPQFQGSAIQADFSYQPAQYFFCECVQERGLPEWC